MAETQLSSSLQNNSEDWIAFLASILSGASSAMGSNPNPSVMMFGLIIASVGKALPSLGQNLQILPSLKDPKDLQTRRKIQKEILEDSILFVGAIAGYLATALSNTHDEKWTVLGVVLGMIGKVIPSLADAEVRKNDLFEDAISIIIVTIGGIMYFLQSDPSYGTFVLALGILAKALPSLRGKKNVESPPAAI
ncbi:hypothetical protein DYY67_1397 [Candidatus Nitrosotalea sp. TS]|uniref:hypothetical protein n=1 Tax=Candidatus Nitrosotalea sp. TS TaxID=2341020 RepID=UPI00140891EF|nr:hypothetical protein [Candidatus Nitrosotalea sp. TS]NHI04022.1 hypothetical protein [Candidatus Nitrosotalea sp. TS]